MAARHRKVLFKGGKTECERERVREIKEMT